MSKAAPPILVQAQWDDEARVWVATSEDVPGLTAEHADFAKLEDMVLELVPMLMVENGLMDIPLHDVELPVHIVAQANAHRQARLAA